MKKLSFSTALVLLIALPGAALAITVAPMQAATSSAPPRAGVASSSKTNTDTVMPPADPQEGSVDYFLEIEGIDGESAEGQSIDPDEIDVMNDEPPEAGKKGNVEYEWKVEEGENIPGAEPDDIDAMGDPQRGSTDYLMEIDGVKGESTDTSKKGNVEYEWKVEEGESTPGSEPDDIDAAEGQEPAASDFEMLLGGGSGDGGAEPMTDETRAEVAEILLQGMQEHGVPIESLSLNYEKIQTKATQSVKFLGVISMTIAATVEVDAQKTVKVQFPWWSFLVSGKNGEALGQQIFSTLSNVLKTKHDTVKNAINNVR